MSYEEFVIKHAKMSSKPHKGASLDDKMSFFHQLSTLVCSGTPLLQAMRICSEQNQSIKMRKVLEEITARVAPGEPRSSMRRPGPSPRSSTTTGSRSSRRAR